MHRVVLQTSDMFKSYEQDYKQHMETVMYNLLNMAKQHNEGADAHIKKLEQDIEETGQCLKQLELEATTLPPAFREETMKVIRQYKKDMAQAEKELTQLKFEQIDRQQTKLFGSREINQALLKQEDRMMQQSMQLIQAKQTAYECESQAIQIQNNLYSQSQGMTNMVKKSSSIREELGNSNSLVNIMKNRIKQRRLLMYGLFGFLTFCGVIIVYSWIS